jgi:outer membrane immunogenic protein
MKRAATGCMAALALFGVGAASGAASAADLAPNPPAPASFTPVPAPLYNWSGVYVGAMAGGSVGIARHQFTDLSVDTENFRVRGGLFGADFGLSYQTGAWVWGLDGDLLWTSISGSQTTAGFPYSAKLAWLSTFRARVGYAFDRFLPYISVGPAFGGLTSSASIPGVGAVSGRVGRSGWALNLGLEYGITQNVTAKLEYLYVCFGESTEFGIDRVTFMNHYARAAVNYKFDWINRDAGRSAAAMPAPGVASAYDWTGFYVGATLGGSWSSIKSTYTLGGVVVNGGSKLTDGGLGVGIHGLTGLEAGYNWQMGHAVVGLETDFQLSQLTGDSAIISVNAKSGAITGMLVNTMDLPLSGTLRARVGYARGRWLFYATGGGVYGEFDKEATLTTSTGGSVTASLDTTKIGWVWGLGVEGALWASWTGKFEYMQMDLGNVSDSFSGIAPFAPVTTNIHLHTNFLRVALAAKFI